MLDTRITFYVPSTDNVDNTTSVQEFNNRTQDIAKVLGREFGGFTITDGLGGWVTEQGELVQEAVKLVSSYTDEATAQAKKADLEALAASKRTEWGQEAISLEIVKVQGGLSFI